MNLFCFKRLKGFTLTCCVFIFLCFISCSATHEIQTKPIAFTGHICDKEKVEFNLKYKLIYDSINSIKIRLYDISGIKLIDVVVRSDTFSIKYILNDSYKDQLYNFYSQLNKEICVYNLLTDLFQGKVFDKAFNQLCYIKTIDENGLVTISSLKFKEVVKFEGLKFKNYFGYKLPSKINILIKGKLYIFTIEK